MNILQRLTILVFVSIQSIGFSQSNPLETIHQKYNALLNEQNKGIAILINKNNKTETLSLGQFNLNENNVFNIGSATKTFTAILFLQEVEKGNLKLTDSISKFLKPIQNVDPTLTIEQLLTHESGLDEIIGRNIETIFYAKNDSLYNNNLLNQVEKNQPEMVGKFDYCNTNYFLLGRIIEKVTDQSYFDLIRERIIKPLKMEHTYPYVHKNLANLATPYHEEKDVTEFLDYKYYANVAYAAGSIASTLSDMEIFYRSLFETEILLNATTVKEMMESGNASYGLGIMKSNKNGTNYFGHGGNNIGYAFRNAYNPETKNLFLLFTNSHRMPLGKSLKNDLFGYLNNEKIESFNVINIDNFKNVTGSYLLKEANLTLQIIAENSKLFLVSEAQGVKSELTQKNKTTLYDTVVGATLTKIDGDEKSLTFSQGSFSTTITKINSDSNKVTQN